MTFESAAKNRKRTPRDGGWNMGGYTIAMHKYNCFVGRASRAEFWHFFVAYTIVAGFFGLPALILAAILNAVINIDSLPMIMVAFLGFHVIPGLAVAVRRMHDIDFSGWWCLLPPLIPVLALIRGRSGANRYGAEPDPIPVWKGHPTAWENKSERPEHTAPPAPQAAPSDIITEIERLSALRAAGGLSEAEYEALKAEALNRNRRA